MRYFYTLIAGILCFVVSLQAQQLKPSKTYHFNDIIGNIRIDTTRSGRNTMRVYTCQKKKNGKDISSNGIMIYYDLDLSKELWHSSVNYDKNVYMLCAARIIGFNQQNYFVQNKDDGKVLWSKNGMIKLVCNKKNMVLAYTGSFFRELNRLEAHDLTTGALKWYTNVDFGWDSDDCTLMDSLLYIYNNSTIYKINLFDGKSSHYNFSHGIFPKVGIKSNIIFSDSCLYVANYNKLYCLDDTLGERWSQKLPKDAVSASYIYNTDSTIVVINSGIGVNQFSMKKDWDHAAIGYPFIAGFNCNTGEKLFFKKMADKKNQLCNYYIKDKTNYLIFDKAVIYSSNIDTAKVYKSEWDANKYGTLRGVYRNNVYFANSDSTIFRNVKSDYYRLIFYTSYNNLYEVNKDMQVIVEHKAGTYFTVAARTNKHVLLKSSKDDSYILVNTLGVKEGIIKDVQPKVVQWKNKVYFISKDATDVIEFDI